MLMNFYMRIGSFLSNIDTRLSPEQLNGTVKFYFFCINDDTISQCDLHTIDLAEVLNLVQAFNAMPNARLTRCPPEHTGCWLRALFPEWSIFIASAWQ